MDNIEDYEVDCTEQEFNEFSEAVEQWIEYKVGKS